MHRKISLMYKRSSRADSLSIDQSIDRSIDHPLIIALITSTIQGLLDVEGVPLLFRVRSEKLYKTPHRTFLLAQTLMLLRSLYDYYIHTLAEELYFTRFVDNDLSSRVSLHSCAVYGEKKLIFKSFKLSSKCNKILIVLYYYRQKSVNKKGT